MQFLFISFFPLVQKKRNYWLVLASRSAFSVTVAKVEDISSRAKKQRYTIAESYIINKRGDFNNHAAFSPLLRFLWDFINISELLVERFSSDRELFKMKQTKTHTRISVIISANLSLLYSLLSCLLFVRRRHRFQIDNNFSPQSFRQSKRPIEIHFNLSA